jgi:hypothetical protein
MRGYSFKLGADPIFPSGRKLRYPSDLGQICISRSLEKHWFYIKP